MTARRCGWRCLRSGVCAALALGVAAVLTAVAGAANDDLTLVSRADGAAGVKGDNASADPALSADGRFVAFASLATNLSPDDTDASYDVFVRDLKTNSTTLVSRAGGPTGDKGNGASYKPAISADGRYVAFLSTASNLDLADSDTSADVFVRDREADTTTLLSRAIGATGPKANAPSRSPAISADGRSVAFVSTATNLDPADTDATADVFVRDLRADTTTLVSRAAASKANGASDEPTLSADGRAVAFFSSASNLDAADTDTTADVFVRDLPANATTLVSRATDRDGAKGNNPSIDPAIAADGRSVAFSSLASNLNPGDTDPTPDVFVRDLEASTTTLVSRAAGTTGAKGNDYSGAPAISSDGRSVAFLANASNLDPADTDTTADVFVRDLQAETTTLVSRATGVTGAKANHSSFTPAISADGRFVAFAAYASNLDPADTDTTLDVFMRDVLGPPPPARPPPPSPAPPASAAAPPAPAAAVAMRLELAEVSVFGRAGARARCAMDDGKVGSCSVRLDDGRRLVARGSAGAAPAATRAVALQLTAYGHALLRRHLGGVRLRAQATAQTSGGERRASAGTRALAAVEHVTTAAGSWRADRAALTARGRRFVRGLRGRLFAVRAVRCDGYAAATEGGAIRLSRRRAALICDDLADHGVHARRRVVARGDAQPIASNRTAAGRARNRRVEITITHLG